jgi:hypothetical protein
VHSETEREVVAKLVEHNRTHDFRTCTFGEICGTRNSGGLNDNSVHEKDPLPRYVHRCVRCSDPSGADKKRCTHEPLGFPAHGQQQRKVQGCSKIHKSVSCFAETSCAQLLGTALLCF